MLKQMIIVASLLAVSFTALAQTPETKDASKDKPENMQSQVIPRNAKVYIAPFVNETSDKGAQGFETYLAAAIRKKEVPVLLVSEVEGADFVISGSADRKDAGWAKKIFFGDLRGSASSALQVINVKTKVIVYADSSDRKSANRGMRSSAEKLAKYLKRKIEDDEKKVHP
jgi:hypothetical protein